MFLVAVNVEDLGTGAEPFLPLEEVEQVLRILHFRKDSGNKRGRMGIQLSFR